MWKRKIQIYVLLLPQDYTLWRLPPALWHCLSQASGTLAYFHLGMDVSFLRPYTLFSLCSPSLHLHIHSSGFPYCLSRYWTFNHGLQVTMWPELPMMNWLLSGPPSHKVGCVHQHSAIKWKWYIGDGAQTSPGGTSKLCEKVTQMLMVLTPMLPSISQPAPYILMRRFLW